MESIDTRIDGVNSENVRVDSENVTVVQASFMNFYSQLDQRMS
jgi:hypothetical protein